MIRYGFDRMIPELKKLWKTCFADEDAYINDFFAALYKGQDVLLAEENGVLMGASFFLPGKLLEGTGPDRWQEIRYVYALAVYPQFRGKGVAGRLLSHAHQTYQAPLIAEPANEGLIGGFYKPLGFEEDFYLEKEPAQIPRSYGVQAAEIRAADSPAGSAGTTASAQEVCSADAVSYAKIRDAYFAKPGYIKWPVEHIAFALQEHRANGGEALIYKSGRKEDLLLYYTEGERAVVTETTLPAAQAAELLSRFISKEHMPQTAVVWKPFSGTAISEKDKDLYRLTGMIYGTAISEEDRGLCGLTGRICGTKPLRGYLNLSLD